MNIDYITTNYPPIEKIIKITNILQIFNKWKTLFHVLLFTCN